MPNAFICLDRLVLKSRRHNRDHPLPPTGMGCDCAFDLQVFLLPDKAAYLTASPVKDLIGSSPAKLRNEDAHRREVPWPESVEKEGTPPRVKRSQIA